MRIIDLTHPIRSGMPIYPGDPPVTVHAEAEVKTDGFRLRRIEFGSHTGTHVDTPAHILPDGVTLDEVPLERLCGRAVVLRAAGLERIDADLVRALPPDAIDFVLIETGWDEKWGGDEYYIGYPLLTKEATALLRQASLQGIGFDCPGPDATDDTSLNNHRALFSAEILLIENLANLRDLPNDPFDFYCIPLPVAGGEASPVRAFAVVDED